MTNKQRNISAKNNKIAWKYFYFEGNGKAKKGYVLHHKDPSWKYNDIERYISWNIEDLEMMTVQDHNKIHKTYELMRGPSDEAHKGAKWYYNVNTNERILSKTDPNKEKSEEWVAGIPPEDVSQLIGETNGMHRKSIYDKMSEEELTVMKNKRHDTYYSKSKEDRELINSRRAHGMPIICINTGEFFRSVSEAARKYKGARKAFKCAHADYCVAGVLYGEPLKWRLATVEEIKEHETV